MSEAKDYGATCGACRWWNEKEELGVKSRHETTEEKHSFYCCSDDPDMEACSDFEDRRPHE